jgi:UDP-N-acetylglucosamine/UDP-N-acetylgalactosamine diphosphorylase
LEELNRTRTGNNFVDATRRTPDLAAAGQEHLLAFWDSLSPDQQRCLSEQIASIDFQQIENLHAQHDAVDVWAELSSRAEVPPAITLEDLKNPESYARAYQRGAEALAAGKVAMILTAGGQGSRLGFDYPKGLFPIGPVSGRSLYQVIIEHVLARARQFGSPVPLYVMTSPPTHDESAAYLREHDNFGYPSGDFKLFCQGTMPAVDNHGKLILGAKDSLFLSPDGHGGMLAALVKSGSLADMLDRGIEHVFYGQVDNPLIQVCDPALIGYHIDSGSEMTTQVVRKHDPLQKVGNVVAVDGKVQIIEYSDLPEEFARQTNPDGSLKLWAGSIAVHVFSTAFLARTSVQADALPFHRAYKKVPYVDASGELVQPRENNAIKFERFIFDLLPWAKNVIVCEVDPAEGFCAVKNAPPAASETPEHVQTAISDLHKSWLKAAGADVAEDAVVEINPLFAVEPTELAKKIKPGTRIEGPTYLHD